MKNVILAFMLCFALTSFAESGKPKKAGPKPTTTTIDVKGSLAFAVADGLPFTVEVKTINDNLFMSAKMDGIGYCLSKSSSITITLENGEAVTFSHINGSECNVSAKYVVLLKPEKIVKLKASPVKSIKMQTDDGSIKLDIIDDGEFFVRNL